MNQAYGPPMKLYVQTIKGYDRRVAQAFDNPERWKCGHCGRGVVFRMHARNNTVSMSACKLCKAGVEWGWK